MLGRSVADAAHLYGRRAYLKTFNLGIIQKNITTILLPNAVGTMVLSTKSLSFHGYSALASATQTQPRLFAQAHTGSRAVPRDKLDASLL